jgi:uncharacterized membrane protein
MMLARVKRRPSLGAIIVFVVGVLIRVWIINTKMGVLNSDEAYSTLQASEILRGHWPVVIPGLVYTSPFDCYLLAPLVALFGHSVMLSKIFPSLAWGSTAILLAACVRHLVGKREGFIAGSLFWLAPGALSLLSVRSWPSYASGMFFVTATLFAVIRLLEIADARAGASPPSRSALVGALGGFAFYLHPMFAVVLLPLLLVPCWKFRKAVRRWWLPAALSAFAVNVPFLLWNVKHHWVSLSQPAPSTEGPAPRLLRLFTGLLPRSYGLRSQSGAWIFGVVGSTLVLLVLLALVVAGVTKVFRVNRLASLVLLLPLAIAWFLMSALTNMSFVADGRYAAATFPFMTAAIGIGGARIAGRRWQASGAVLAVWVALLVAPFLVRDSGTRFHDPNAGAREIAAYLESRHIDRVSGYYWTILPIELVSNQRIRTSLAGNPYVVQLPWTQLLVSETPSDKLVFIWPNRDQNSFVPRLPFDQYEIVELAGSVIYIPKGMS